VALGTKMRINFQFKCVLCPLVKLLKWHLQPELAFKKNVQNAFVSCVNFPKVNDNLTMLFG